MSQPVSREQRHTRAHRCPICGGADQDPRGKEKRCAGFTNSEVGFAHCSREEHAGAIERNDAGLYGHRLHGACKCGAQHGPAREAHEAHDIEAVYPYTDERGALLYEVVRKVGKRFLQRKPDGAGGWEWKLGDVRRVPYRLPALRAADPERTVYIVEGEKDVASLEAIGELATCNAGGAGKWASVQEVAASVLHGRTIVVVADRDAPGRKHASQIVEALQAVARSVVAMEAPDPNKDVTDLLRAGGTLRDLQPMGVDGESPRLLRLVSSDAETRPEIKLGPETHLVTAAMLQALLADPELYQRNDLVHVLRDEGDGEWTPDAKDWRAPGTPIVRVCPASWLVDRVSMHARCLRKTKGGDMWRHVEPPKARVTAVLERGAWPGIRPLEIVLEAPSMRPDGSLLQEPGYDRRTRSLFLPNATFPRVPEAPSHSDAVLAYAHLADVFADFPYVSPEHGSAVIAAILTLLARPAIRRSVPCWLFDASASRSGKSLQTDVISAICFGRMASRSTYPETDEELEKVLGGYAMDGARLVNFDNIARKFGGAPLDKCITATDRVSLRILGKTGQPEQPWRAVIFGSGNNITCRGDMLPRVLAPRLESPLENPETRRDLKHKDLRSYALAHRAQLVADALTILRAYVVAGRPDVGTGKWGGFEDWSELIAPALVWVGAANPMGARRGLAGDEDPTRAFETALVAGWDALCRAADQPGLTAKGALAVMYPAPRRDEPPDGLDDMREAVEHLTSAKPGIGPGSSAFGTVLRALKARPISGKKLITEGKTGGVARWRTVATT